MAPILIINESWAGDNFVISYIKLGPNTNVAALEEVPAFLNKYQAAQLKKEGMKKKLYLQPVNTIHTTPRLKGLELSKPVSLRFSFTRLILIAVLIQIIACITFMNLSTARAAERKGSRRKKSDRRR